MRVSRIALLGAVYACIAMPDLARAQTAASAGSLEQAVAAAPREVHVANPSERFPERWYPSDKASAAELPGPVAGAPYRAVEVTYYAASTGVAAHQQREVRFRDSAGRERRESVSGGGTDNGKAYALRSVTVGDPVSHCSFSWTVRDGDAVPAEREPIAIVQCGPRSVTYVQFDIEAAIMKSIVAMPQEEGTKVTPLTGSFAGLPSTGLRTERVLPGTSGDIEVSEMWISPYLHTIVKQTERTRSKLHGDTDGTSTTLGDVELKEPDEALFYPPAGYRILTLAEARALPPK